ncbi:NACHT domain-containing protein [Actinomadura sp. DC4]|uniref:NACHT domain-containing protein n=1 Tax=Actinomadura sp. DC4 TaxID=3055069 RepID=UPI0025B1AF0F|nr:NACHT domain-containing protein [Actinomadura sp. DC4]MDN3356818.1 NACHT domain-containing protein [Actinomadura sp. DC4]
MAGHDDRSGDTYNTVSNSVVRFLVQARDIEQITIHVERGSPQDDATERLASQVRARWLAEVAVLGVDDEYPLEVRWSTSDLPVAGREPRIAGLASAFHELHQRMVVVGDQGAGKTTLAMLLVLELLAQRKPRNPIPVLLSISSWSEEEHLHTWMARRLGEEHPWLRGQAGELVSERRVFPVLDGLDELPEARRAECLARINRSLSTKEPIVLTCRTAEYEAAVAAVGGELRSAIMLRAEPVSPDAAARYLRESVPHERADEWVPVLRQLFDSRETPLAAALKTPLMIWLLRTVYSRPNTHPGELADPLRFSTAEAVRDHLLDGLIPAVYGADPPAPERRVRRWDAQRADAWLRFLARHLVRQGTDELAWWQLHRAIPRALSVPAVAALVVFVFVPLAEWIAATLADVPASVARPDVNVAMVTGLFVGFCVEILVARLFGFRVGQPSGRTRLPRLRAALAALRKALFSRWGKVGLAFTAVLGLFGTVGNFKERAVSLVGAGVFLLLVLFKVAVAAPAAVDEVTAPDTLLRGDRRATVLTLSVVGGIVWAGDSGLAAYAGVHSLISDVCIGLGALAGTTIAVLVLSAWFRWVLTRVSLAGSGRLPWSLVRFLRDAHKLGLLRQVGGVYQFRHRSVRDRLAGFVTNDSAPVTVVPVPEAPLSVMPRIGAAESAIPDGEYRCPLRGPVFRPRMLMLFWPLALAIIVLLNQSGWYPGAWRSLVVLLALPFLALTPLLVMRRKYSGELVINGEFIEVTNPLHPFRLSWQDIDKVTVGRARTAPGQGSNRYALQVQLRPSAQPPARAIYLRDGHLLVCYVGRVAKVTPQLHQALAQFAGPRWNSG